MFEIVSYPSLLFIYVYVYVDLDVYVCTCVCYVYSELCTPPSFIHPSVPVVTATAGNPRPTPRPIDWIVLITTQTRDARQVWNKRFVKLYFSSQTHSAFVGLLRYSDVRVAVALTVAAGTLRVTSVFKNLRKHLFNNLYSLFFTDGFETFLFYSVSRKNL